MFVSMWMTRDVLTVTPTATLAEIATLMMRRGIRRLPVVSAPGERGSLLGGCAKGRARRCAGSTWRRWGIGRCGVGRLNVTTASFTVGQRQQRALRLPLGGRIEECFDFARGAEQHNGSPQFAAILFQILFLGRV